MSINTGITDRTTEGVQLTLVLLFDERIHV